VRALLFIAALGPLFAQWSELAPGTRALIKMDGTAFDAWMKKRNERLSERLDEGAAEHITYFLLQSEKLSNAPVVTPLRAARGESAEAVAARVKAFWESEPIDERHRILRRMAPSWPRERVIETAFRFLRERTGAGSIQDVEALYQQRGLSADPYPPSMKAVRAGLDFLGARRTFRRVLLIGPGMELGSRFGVDDSAPVMSPQPKALLAMLRAKPARFDCIDVRREIVESLRAAPCRAIVGDIVTMNGGGPYDLLVATNVLTYLDDVELAVAFSNLARATAPGGCFIHNDTRFAVRVAGEAAGFPVREFKAISLGMVNGREQFDRAVVHCRPK